MGVKVAFSDVWFMKSEPAKSTIDKYFAACMKSNVRLTVS